MQAMMANPLFEPPRREPITVLLQCTNLGGMEQVAFSLFAQLQSLGHTLQIASPRGWGLGRPYVLKADPAAQAFEYRGKFGWKTFSGFQRHVLNLSRNCHDVWVIGTCASCLAAARRTGKRILLSHHYHHFERHFSRLRWTAFYTAFGRSLHAVTFPTEFTRKEACRIAPWLRSKFHVVRNGFTVQYFDERQRLQDRRSARRQLGIPEDAFVVGNAGWLTKRKRFDIFLQTAQRLVAQLPNAQFVICGGGPEGAALDILARELGIAQRVRFQGWVEDLGLHYRAWDALLFNSDFDTLPCAPMEAACWGCISVASCRYGGLSEFLKTGQTGVLFKQHDPDELAEVLLQVARNPAFALKLREGAATRLRNEFSQTAGRQFYEHYFRSDAD